MAKLNRALISVSDKEGIVDFARKLTDFGVEIVSTGGTARAISEAGIPVREVSELTGFPEMLNGRVKTLHPKVHGGILAIRENKQHMEDLQKNGIEPIDMVVVNLYPFEATVKKEGVSREEVIENIDIGGPTLLRSAAKNYNSVVVLTDPSDYQRVLKEMEASGEVSEQTRAHLAVKAFMRTAEYDLSIEKYLGEKFSGEKGLWLKYTQGQSLRYGENWHQKATFYKDRGVEEPCIANAVQVHGKQMSYNNYLDANAALEAVKELEKTFGVAIIKHTNPCGYATGKTLREAMQAAWAGDPVSAFGSVIATTREIDLEAAEFLKGKFVEALVAPGYKEDALQFLKEKSKDIRLLKTLPLDVGRREKKTYRHIVGGILEQDRDLETLGKWKPVTKKEFPSEKRPLAEFAFRAVKHTKSNAIVLASEYTPGQFQVLGMGAGQPNRLEAMRIAIRKAKENLSESYFKKWASEAVLASDAFFPFDDNITLAHENHIQYIVQPGGSVRDKQVISTADRLGLSMVFTGTRHFLH